MSNEFEKFLSELPEDEDTSGKWEYIKNSDDPSGILRDPVTGLPVLIRHELPTDVHGEDQGMTSVELDNSVSQLTSGQFNSLAEYSAHINSGGEHLSLELLQLLSHPSNFEIASKQGWQIPRSEITPSEDGNDPAVWIDDLL